MKPEQLQVAIGQLHSPATAPGPDIPNIHRTETDCGLYGQAAESHLVLWVYARRHISKYVAACQTVLQFGLQASTTQH